MKINIPLQTQLYFLLLFVGLSGFGFTFFLPSPYGFYASIIAAALAGLGVALNVYRTKKHNQQLVCPTGSDCNAVVTSRYAKFFGIPLEYLGMVYYIIIALAYAAFIFIPAIFTPGLTLAVVILSALAGLFSVYLLFVQAVLLRKWCIWCILSALLSLAICVFSLVSTTAVVEFITEFDYVFELIRTLGLALGVGGATASALLFFQFLDDQSIDDKELSAIQGVFELVWVGVGLVIIGQFGLYVAYPELLAQSGVFAVQMISLAVAVIAGAALMIVYAPFVTYVPFGDSDEENSSFADLRKPVLSIGAVVLVAWYFTFLVTFLPAPSATYLLVVLLSLLSVAVLAALAWDKYLALAEHTS